MKNYNMSAQQHNGGILCHVTAVEELSKAEQEINRTGPHYIGPKEQCFSAIVQTFDEVESMFSLALSGDLFMPEGEREH